MEVHNHLCCCYCPLPILFCYFLYCNDIDNFFAQYINACQPIRFIRGTSQNEYFVLTENSTPFLHLSPSIVFATDPSLNNDSSLHSQEVMSDPSKHMN
jgi:hypothetical protein